MVSNGPIGKNTTDITDTSDKAHEQKIDHTNPTILNSNRSNKIIKDLNFNSTNTEINEKSNNKNEFTSSNSQSKAELTTNINNIHNIQFNYDNLNHQSTFTNKTISINNHIHDVVIDIHNISDDNLDDIADGDGNKYDTNEPSNTMYDNIQLERVLNDIDEKEDDLDQFISEIKNKHDINDHKVNDDYKNKDRINRIEDDIVYPHGISDNTINNSKMKVKIDKQSSQSSIDTDKCKSDIKIQRNNDKEKVNTFDNIILHSPTA